MAEQKIFAGPRIRRIRNERGLTQTAMAEALGISPSYLNLIERNQRPLTVQLLLKLASVYHLELGALQAESGTTIAGLKEVFSDPLLAGELPGDQELIEIGDAAPNAAAGIVKLYRAYREQLDRLSDLSDLLAQEGRETSLSAARLPLDEVHDVLEHRPNHFPLIEEEAESFASLLKPGDDLMGALKNWLRTEHGIVVRVLPVATMPNWRRRYDRHSQRLFLSERLSPFDQLREVAMEAVLIRMQVAIAAEVERLKLSSSEARRIARFELGRYAAHALMMPYEAFRSAAQRARYDIDVLRSRFGVSFEQAANRLTTLQRQGAAGVSFFMLETDHAGNRFRKAGAQGFPQARFGGQCPRLAIYTAFAQPSQILVEAVEMPDGAAFLTIARTLEGPQGAFDERPRRTAILLGCDLSLKDEIVYGAALTGSAPTPIGPACRLCERQGCLARAEPPLTRPLGLDEMVTGLSAFDFQ
ncbi:ImmA/IrrE family metallo-endopeptidase [Phyllobacterium salinisoli]|uniref:ImmA/IrrE family metallo-endopeptidase n=1 Tax=Phyllobacterium salinisoli TaxID=1899321 RepID=A0A368K5H9_9HYPH|nr:helix-turn-helix domain-containing protein [Phyllobacterium salinisoli]RCS24646.1 ImmA/IrrE family metallo-endopeptidase [Phyllobacterium salinisoli]